VPGICANLAFADLLEQLDVRRHVAQVWGTSAGAVVGGGWASGSPASKILAQVRSLDRRGAVDAQRGRLFAAALLWRWRRRLPEGLIGGRHFADAIARGLTATTFEDCPTQFRCVAIPDDGTLTRKVFRKGPLLPAIFASMSLPGIFVPRVHPDGTTYYDGGLVEKTPLLSPIAEHDTLGEDRELLVLGTHFDNEAKRIRPHGFFARFLQAIYAMESALWDHQLAQARQRKNVSLILLNPRLEDGGMFDFRQVDATFAYAAKAFADQLQNAKLAYSFGAV
jgi:predicted acylesterase/phospholipase RssA